MAIGKRLHLEKGKETDFVSHPEKVSNSQNIMTTNVCKIFFCFLCLY